MCVGTLLANCGGCNDRAEGCVAADGQSRAQSGGCGQVGIFSTYGVSEVRDLFWKRFQSGKAFAQRSTMWDMLFVGISSMGRDEGLGGCPFPTHPSRPL